jgi:hypothetical protein
MRLLESQIATALTACGELKADLRILDGEIDAMRLVLAKMPANGKEYQDLQLEVARLKERMSIIVAVLAVVQILGTAIAAYLASVR